VGCPGLCHLLHKHRRAHACAHKILLFSCRKRLGPQAAEEHKKNVLAKAEEKIIKGLGFTPGACAFDGLTDRRTQCLRWRWFLCTWK
jgi:hypothetical protein